MVSKQLTRCVLYAHTAFLLISIMLLLKLFSPFYFQMDYSPEVKSSYFFISLFALSLFYSLGFAFCYWRTLTKVEQHQGELSLIDSVETLSDKKERVLIWQGQAGYCIRLSWWSVFGLINGVLIKYKAVSGEVRHLFIAKDMMSDKQWRALCRQLLIWYSH